MLLELEKFSAVSLFTDNMCSLNFHEKTLVKYFMFKVILLRILYELHIHNLHILLYAFILNNNSDVSKRRLRSFRNKPKFIIYSNCHNWMKWLFIEKLNSWLYVNWCEFYIKFIVIVSSRFDLSISFRTS